MLAHISLEHGLVVDIETVSQHPDWHALSAEWKTLWELKAARIGDLNVTSAENLYQERAGIFAEFGKIICISAGFFTTDAPGHIRFRVKSFYGNDEKSLLMDFSRLLAQFFNRPDTHFLCGHNIQEFDIPFICRRMLVQDIVLPEILQIAGKKPWEVKHVDTMQLWRFGDYKHYTSLKLLAALFGLPSSKDDIDGSEVGKVYWEEKNVERIARYCEKDVILTARLLLRMKGLPPLEDNHIQIKDVNS